MSPTVQQTKAKTMTETEMLKEYIKAAIKCVGWDDLNVFDYDDSEDYDDPSKGHQGVRIAEKENPEDTDGFEIIIVMRKQTEMLQTLGSKIPQVVTYYDIHTPVYDSGDRSVGMDGYFFTDPDNNPTWTFKSASDAALKSILWVMEFELNIAMENTGEYLWYQQEKDLEQV